MNTPISQVANSPGAEAAPGENSLPLRGWLLCRSYLIGLSILAAVIGFNLFCFSLWNEKNYFDWYLENGKWASFVTSILGLVWTDLNKRQDFISRHPLRYLRECSWLVGVAIFSLGTPLKKNRTDSRPANLLDGCLAVLFCFITMGLLVGWFVLVVPLQYFVHLIAGAPARFFLSSDWRTIVSPESGQKITTTEVHASDPMPQGWRQVTWVEKPVTTTSLAAILLLELQRQFA